MVSKMEGIVGLADGLVRVALELKKNAENNDISKCKENVKRLKRYLAGIQGDL